MLHVAWVPQFLLPQLQTWKLMWFDIYLVLSGLQGPEYRLCTIIMTLWDCESCILHQNNVTHLILGTISSFFQQRHIIINDRILVTVLVLIGLENAWKCLLFQEKYLKLQIFSLLKVLKCRFLPLYPVRVLLNFVVSCFLHNDESFCDFVLCRNTDAFYGIQTI